MRFTITTITMEQPVSEFKSKSGLKRIFTAFLYSLDGFRAAWRNEHAFRQEVGLFVAGAVIALLLKVSAFEKLVLIGVLVLILIVELINSSIEAVVDRVSLERHPLSKNAKDFGSAAVLLTCLLAVATWGVVLYNRFI
ncbi:diacylglycerol kinase [Duganella sp. FT50W]|uniref:Diacylglycerol kinase n=2 Tax=Duganella lactea TaxID=2692173 RepID=A0A6L8MQQ3_9BURK|nr:diacylglycerol kinase [Duganella lactea]MYM83068.1 diacylglycerol kinase [Duganella lactea]